MTTELFVIFKELKNSYSTSVLKRTQSLSLLIVDMFRVLEVLTGRVPELFLDRDQPI